MKTYKNILWAAMICCITIPASAVEDIVKASDINLSCTDGVFRPVELDRDIPCTKRQLATAGRAGLTIYGPYGKLDMGEYSLICTDCDDYPEGVGIQMGSDTELTGTFRPGFRVDPNIDGFSQAVVATVEPELGQSNLSAALDISQWDQQPYLVQHAQIAGLTIGATPYSQAITAIAGTGTAIEKVDILVESSSTSALGDFNGVVVTAVCPPLCGDEKKADPASLNLINMVTKIDISGSGLVYDASPATKDYWRQKKANGEELPPAGSLVIASKVASVGLGQSADVRAYGLYYSKGLGAYGGDGLVVDDTELPAGSNETPVLIDNSTFFGNVDGIVVEPGAAAQFIGNVAVDNKGDNTEPRKEGSKGFDIVDKNQCQTVDLSVNYYRTASCK